MENNKIDNEEPVFTMRDVFAAAALTGFVTNNGTDFTSIKLAEWSYSQADAMIEARKETQP
jgi:hypothetical protein